MKAIRVYEFGAPEVMRCEEVAEPVCAADQVLVQVAAAALNPIDYKIREGSHLLCPSMTLPSGLGFDFSGEVLACGDAVTSLKVGDRVIGMAGFPLSPCAYQAQLAVAAEHCVTVPAGVDLQSLAGLPLAGLTAWQAVHEHGQVQAGQKVLIHAAAGGVGSLAVQFAKAAGAEVYVTASRAKHELLTSLGADHCVDYQAQPFYQVLPAAMDVVIDLVGAQVGIDSLRALKPGGTLVTVPSFSKDAVLAAAAEADVKAAFFLMAYRVETLAEMVAQVAAGQLQVLVGGRYPLSEAATAHQQLESGRAIGKLLLIP